MIFKSSQKRRIGGKIAKLEGEALEARIEPLARQIGAIAIKIPNAAKTIKVKGILRVVRAKSPFDYMIAKFPQVVYFDCKSINAATFPASLVTPHQLDLLLQLELNGFSAGFLINFRKLQWVSFVKASTLQKLKKGESVSSYDGVHLGTSSNFSLAGLFK